MPEIQNLGQLYQRTAKRFPKKPAFLSKVGGAYSPILWEDAARRIEAAASALLSLGVKPQDRIAILSENRPEWAMMDLAAQTIGAVTVPIYPSLTAPEIRYILEDSGAVIVAVSDRGQLQKIVSVQAQLPKLKAVLGFDFSLSAFHDEVRSKLLLWRDLVQTPAHGELALLTAAVPPDAVASIIYTSGTTGFPKGVMLTHANFLHNVVGCRDTLEMSENDVHLSFLPLCHVFERTAGYYLMVYIGATIAYAENLDAVPKNILDVKPTFLLGVPRFYEKIQARVLEAVKKTDPIRKGLFFWARDLGEARRLGKRKRGFSDAVAQALVYTKFHSSLGGKLRFCISGGAPLSREIAEFFSDLGVTIYEGYGLTETSPVIAVNREKRRKFGTVGVALDGVEIRIAEDGEILTKSPSVMKGYYNRPEETAAAVTDGWFHTGDLGRVDAEGFLSITGRKKELIVTSGGKKISPQPIEEMLSQDPMILRCVLYGEGKKFVTALIVPRKEELLAHAEAQKMAYSSYEELLQDPKIYQFLDARIQLRMADFASYEKIKYFALLDRDFSQAAGELTPTLKIKRETILSRYKDLLAPFYTENYSRPS